MRVLFCGDAACASGFSKLTHAVCDYLHSQGHAVHVLGLNFYGDPHSYPYHIYPCNNPLDYGTDPFGVNRLPALVHRIKPDIVVILNDPWNIRAYLDRLLESQVDCPPVIAWLAVDSKNQMAAKHLNHSHLSHVVCWTEFGAQEIRAGGYTGNISIVPCGVDSEVYCPMDRTECRKTVLGEEYGNLLAAQADGEDLFIVGYVGRNQYRKRLDLLIEYFAEFAADKPNAYLFLHIPPTGEDFYDIQSLCAYYRIGDQVITSSPERGFPESAMPVIYNCFDVFLTTSQAEGWCLPVIESMACGVQCIFPDQGGLSRDGGWVGEVGVAAVCTSTALTAPFPVGLYTIGGVADRETVIAALNDMYTYGFESENRLDMFDVVWEFSWESAAASFASVIDFVLDPLNHPA